MLKTFLVCDSHNIDTMFHLVDEMKRVLASLDAGDIPNQTDYTRQDLLDYCKSLVKGQRGNIGRTKPGSWSVAPNDEGMPSDARVDFIFTPTYIAVATLSRILQDHPTIAIQIPGFLKSLKRGMLFCTYRELQGHGYDAIDGMLDAIMILSIGKVPALLDMAPEFSKKLRGLFGKVEKYLSEHLLHGETLGPWGENYSPGYQAALETLYISKDKDLLGSIQQARSVGISGCARDLSW